MKKPEVGQKLYSLNVGNACRNVEKKLTPVIVTRVGRKYFTCIPKGGSKWKETQYHLNGWHEKSEYSADSILYGNPQEWEDEKESIRICRLIWKCFEYGRNPKNISLAAIRTIYGIITANEKKNGL